MTEEPDRDLQRRDQDRRNSRGRRATDAVPPVYSAVLADDVPELRRLLRQVLHWSERFAVLGEAEDGKAAVELAARHKPDVMLLDISMPVMDGMEALPLIKKASPGTKVVILSGFEAARLAEAAVGLGASAYIEKGVSPSLLVTELLKVVEVDGSGGAVTLPVPLPPELSGAASLQDISAEEMMSLVAHEIRNPLAVIQGFGTELANRWDTMSEELKLDSVRRMTERARYLNTVVNNLMFMRKLEAGEYPFVPNAEEVRPLMESMSEELRDLSRGHPLEFEIADDLPPVSVDIVRLRQVLTNLVVNAAKFSPANKPITIGAERTPDGVVISVTDRGPGIPSPARKEVFEKFKRLEQGGSGIGLGLFISRALMSTMGGEMWLADSDGGARFCCLLPEAD